MVYSDVVDAKTSSVLCLILAFQAFALDGHVDTSVLNVIGVTELFFMSKSAAGNNFRY